jgi:hypothetical protein
VTSDPRDGNAERPAGEIDDRAAAFMGEDWQGVLKDDREVDASIIAVTRFLRMERQ